MITIDELLQYLRRANPNADVIFDFCRCVPTTVASSRGNYSTPALGWRASGYSGDGMAPTVASLISELEKAIDGRKYMGWKGGEFTYTPTHTICVDNPGDWTDTQIVRVENQDWQVVLHTLSGN